MSSQVTRVKAKWARPWFPFWRAGESTYVALIGNGSDSSLPDVYSAEFLTLVPAELHGKFKIICTIRDAISVKWEDRALVTRIFAAIVEAGYSIYVQARIAFNVCPADLEAVSAAEKLERPVKEFSPRLLELFAVRERSKTIRRMDSLDPRLAELDLFFQPVIVWTKESAWFTPEGKQFAREMRKRAEKNYALRNNIDSDSEEEMISDTETVFGLNPNDEVISVKRRKVETAEEKKDEEGQKQEHQQTAPIVVSDESDQSADDRVEATKTADKVPVAAATVSASSPAAPAPLALSAEPDDFVCLVCMENTPNTIAHPCNHCVVCIDCARRLENTADRDRCVKCRNKMDYWD